MGPRPGFINPILYSKGTNAFRDIVPGGGPADNANGGVAGWDACTGWGSIDGDDRVFYSSFNGITWAPQQRIVGIGTNPFDIREPEAATAA